jgi:hypothetical protein
MSEQSRRIECHVVFGVPHGMDSQCVAESCEARRLLAGDVILTGAPFQIDLDPFDRIASAGRSAFMERFAARGAGPG